eukprot:1178280-Prorocentrum_minimum.AAC.1
MTARNICQYAAQFAIRCKCLGESQLPRVTWVLKRGTGIHKIDRLITITGTSGKGSDLTITTTGRFSKSKPHLKRTLAAPMSVTSSLLACVEGTQGQCTGDLMFDVLISQPR